MNFAKFLRTHFKQNTSGRLLPENETNKKLKLKNRRKNIFKSFENPKRKVRGEETVSLISMIGLMASSLEIVIKILLFILLISFLLLSHEINVTRS